GVRRLGKWRDRQHWTLRRPCTYLITAYSCRQGSGELTGCTRLSLDRVLQRHGPRLLVRLAMDELQLGPLGRRRHQGNPPTEQDRYDRHLDGVHEPSIEQAAKERSAAVQPDVLASAR